MNERELFRLFRKAGTSRTGAVALVFVAMVTESVAEAMHATIEHLLDVLPEDEEGEQQ